MGSNNFSHQITTQDSKGVRGGEEEEPGTLKRAGSRASEDGVAEAATSSVIPKRTLEGWS